MKNMSYLLPTHTGITHNSFNMNTTNPHPYTSTHTFTTLNKHDFRHKQYSHRPCLVLVKIINDIINGTHNLNGVWMLLEKSTVLKQKKTRVKQIDKFTIGQYLEMDKFVLARNPI